jgi:hypothetical protein
LRRLGGRLQISDAKIQEEQEAVCKQYAALFTSALGEVNSGFALSTNGQLPVNGLRHPTTDDTTGWYIWCGEQLSDASDFFAPTCTSHVYEAQPAIAKLLGLPPGYRFLLAGEYRDVWFDESLLDT